MYSELRVKYLQKMINKFDGLHDNIDKLISYENMNSKQTGGATLAQNVTRLRTATTAIGQKIETANDAIQASNTGVARLVDERDRAAAAARRLLDALTAARVDLETAKEAVRRAADTAQALAGTAMTAPSTVPVGDAAFGDLMGQLEDAAAAQ